MEKYEALNDASERTPKDYAIEFGEYLAKSAENFMAAVNRENDPDCRNDAWRGLECAIYEFRKRAGRAS